MTPEREAAYRAALEEALRAGYDVIQNGGSALDAVTTAIPLLEDSPLFNAGRGAVFTSEGTVELDASIMSGETLAAGAVAGVKHIKNPVRLARLVMEDSPHVMMIGRRGGGVRRAARRGDGRERVFLHRRRAAKRSTACRSANGRPPAMPGARPRRGR